MEKQFARIAGNNFREELPGKLRSLQTSQSAGQRRSESLSHSLTGD